MAWTNNLVSDRFKNDGKAAVEMTVLQKEGRQMVLDRLGTGAYRPSARDCALCGSSDITIIAEKDRFGIPNKTGICQQCSLIQTVEPLRHADYVDFFKYIYRPLYGGTAPLPVDGYNKEKQRGKVLLDLIQNFVPDGKGLRVLEIGCGSGGILGTFKEAGYVPRGYDLNEGCLNYGRSQGLDLHLAPFEEVNEAEPFDLVIVSHVFQYLHDLRGAVKKIRTLVKTGGFLIMETPGLNDLADPNNRYDFDFLKYLHNICLYHFDKDMLVHAMTSAGFECQYSNDIVRAVFRATEEASPFQPDGNKAKKTLAFLRSVENARKQRALYLALRRMARQAKEKLRFRLARLGLLS